VESLGEGDRVGSFLEVRVGDGLAEAGLVVERIGGIGQRGHDQAVRLRDIELEGPDVRGRAQRPRNSALVRGDLGQRYGSVDGRAAGQ